MPTHIGQLGVEHDRFDEVEVFKVVNRYPRYAWSLPDLYEELTGENVGLASEEEKKELQGVVEGLEESGLLESATDTTGLLHWYYPHDSSGDSDGVGGLLDVVEHVMAREADEQGVDGVDADGGTRVAEAMVDGQRENQPPAGPEPVDGGVEDDDVDGGVNTSESVEASTSNADEWDTPFDGISYASDPVVEFGEDVSDVDDGDGGGGLDGDGPFVKDDGVPCQDCLDADGARCWRDAHQVSDDDGG